MTEYVTTTFAVDETPTDLELIHPCIVLRAIVSHDL